MNTKEFSVVSVGFLFLCLITILSGVLQFSKLSRSQTAAVASIVNPDTNALVTGNTEIVQGIVQAVVAPDGSEGYELDEDSGALRIFNLKIDKTVDYDFVAGDTISVDGIVSGTDLYPNPNSASPVVVMTPVSVPPAFLVSPASSQTPTTLKVEVMLLSFNDAPPDMTKEEVNNIFFGTNSSLAGYFKENTLGNFILQGSVKDWSGAGYSLGSNCHIDSAKIFSGWTYSDSAKFIVTPKSITQRCGAFNTIFYKKTSNIPVIWARNISSYTPLARVLFYTIGGLKPPTGIVGLNCGTTQSTNCAFTKSDRTRDPNASDFQDMRGVGKGHFGLRTKTLMGYLPVANVATVTQNGTYTVYALEKSSEGKPQGLRIPASKTGSFSFTERVCLVKFCSLKARILAPDLAIFDTVISYRAKYGFDNVDDVQDGAYVHLWTTGSYKSMYPTLRMDPTPSNGPVYAALSDGQSFYDAARGVTITQLSHDADSATVSVKFENLTSCVRKAPIVAPKQTADPRIINFEVINNDSPLCSTSTFTVTPTLPSGWSAKTWNVDNVPTTAPITLSVLNPQGNSRRIDATLNIPTGTVGKFSIPVVVKDILDPTHSTTGTVSVVVPSSILPPPIPFPDDPKPPTPSSSLINFFTASPDTLVQGQQSTISWSTASGALCYGSWVGNQQVSGNGSYTFTPAKTTGFTLSCSAGSVSDYKSVNITVGSATPPGGSCGKNCL